MKSQHLPLFCGAALAVMSAAGASHWCSVREFAAAAAAGLPLGIPAAPAAPAPPSVTPPAPASAPASPQLAALQAPPAGPRVSGTAEQKFYEALVAKMENLQNQNQDLLDQVAETNRDVMKLEFRVDTHSESFRPMPVSEDRFETSSAYVDGEGVLPPRAMPVDLPFDE